jgi:hypothetical protein
MEFRDVRLDYLLELRETIEARIRRMNDDAATKAGALAEAEAELAEVNDQIAHHRPRES